MINLLPDTRQVKQRSHQRRQLVGTVATVICVVCAGAMLLLFLSVGSATIIKNKLTSDIATKKASLEAVPGIVDALTAQEHLDSLPALYANRIYVTKFFAAYTVANPTDVALNSLTVNPDNSLLATGTGNSYASVSKLALALEAEKDSNGNNKFTTVEIQSAGSQSGNVSFSLNIVMAQGVTSGN
jgi:hypothetical protein